MAVSVKQAVGGGTVATVMAGLVTMTTLYFNSQEKVATINAAARNKASDAQDLKEDWITCKEEYAVCRATCGN